MNNILIRPATTADIETLLLFEQGVITAERPFDTTLGDDPIHYYNLPALIESEQAELAVAELDGEIIASGYARIEDAKPYLRHRQFAYLGFMYVVPSQRGKGVNKQIINYLANWAAAKNIFELRLDVYFDNASAIKAYEKLGFDKHMIEMRINIAGNNKDL